MTKKNQHRVQKAMRTLDDIMGRGGYMNLDLKNQFIKEIIVSRLNIPKIKQKNNMMLLVKNTIDDTLEKISKTKSNSVIHPSYKSHKLLKQMEAKEARYKKLQRLKELSMKNKGEHREMSMDQARGHKRVSYPKSSLSRVEEQTNQGDQTKNVSGATTHTKSFVMSSVKKYSKVNSAELSEAISENEGTPSVPAGVNIATGKLYQTVVDSGNRDKSFFGNKPSQDTFKHKIRGNIENDLENYKKIQIVKVNRKIVDDYSNRKLDNTLVNSSEHLNTGKNSDNPSGVSTPGKHMLPSLQQDASASIPQQSQVPKQPQKMKKAKMGGKSISQKKVNLTFNGVKTSPHRLRDRKYTGGTTMASAYKNVPSHPLNQKSLSLNKGKIYLDGLGRKNTGELMKANLMNYMDLSLRDQVSPIKKSKTTKKMPGRSKSDLRRRKNNEYQSSYTKIFRKRDFSKKNLKLYLPQIDGQGGDSGYKKRRS